MKGKLSSDTRPGIEVAWDIVETSALSPNPIGTVATAVLDANKRGAPLCGTFLALDEMRSTPRDDAPGHPSSYGAADEVGAGNLITAEVMLEAVKLVRAGRSYPLAVPIGKSLPAWRVRLGHRDAAWQAGGCPRSYRWVSLRCRRRHASSFQPRPRTQAAVRDGQGGQHTAALKPPTRSALRSARGNRQQLLAVRPEIPSRQGVTGGGVISIPTRSILLAGSAIRRATATAGQPHDAWSSGRARDSSNLRPWKWL